MSTVANAHDLVPSIRKRSDEIESLGYVPHDLLDELKAAGLFRMTVPQSHGGDELPLLELMDAVMALARADGAVAWIVNLAADASLFATGLERSTYEEVYANGPDVIFAGSGALRGNTAELADGGYIVNGRWPFASGCRGADYLMAWGARTQNGEPLPGPAPGMPDMWVMYAPTSAEGVEIVHTWDVLGLRGTGSEDFTFTNVFVPDRFAFQFPPHLWPDRPLYRMPYFGSYALRFGAVALGIAQGAMDELIELSAYKRPTLSPGSERSSETYLFRHELGQADALLRAATDALFTEAGRFFQTAVDGTEYTADRGIRARSTGAWVTETATQVVDMLYGLGGAHSLYNRSPLQHRLRDIHVVTQHIAIRRETYADVGTVLTGGELPKPPIPLALRDRVGDRRDLFFT